MSIDLDSLWDFDDLAASKARFEAALAKAEGGDDQATLHSQLARIAGLEGDFTSAETLLDQAEALGPGPAVFARITLERGRLARDRNLEALAATAFHQATKRARRSGALDVALDALHMQAIAAPPEVAAALLEQAEAICRKAPALQHWLGPFYNNLGWSRFENGDTAGALEMFNRDKALRRRIGAENERRIAALNSAKMLRFLGRHSEALDQLQRLVVEIGPQGFGLGLVFEERAELAQVSGRLDEARHYAGEARRLFLARGLRQEDQPARFERLDQLAARGG